MSGQPADLELGGIPSGLAAIKDHACPDQTSPQQTRAYQVDITNKQRRKPSKIDMPGFRFGVSDGAIGKIFTIASDRREFLLNSNLEPFRFN